MSNKELSLPAGDMPEGFEVQAQPERLTWEPKSGKFLTEFGEVIEIPFHFLVVGTVNCFSAWGETLGRPRCQSIGECCGAYDDCSRGVRIGMMLLDEMTGQQMPYYIDLYGLSAKAGGRIVRLIQVRPDLVMARTKTINTQNGPIIVPVADLPDEASLPGKVENDAPPIV